jgi:hypothetical protein
MFSSEFFPTPLEVIDQMGIDCYDKHVLEPSAGSGNIVSWLRLNGSRSISACETNEKLRSILNGKCNLIGTDFFNLKADQVSHINLIVMNPPFSNADKHILHAWTIAPEGCEIISLCNYETVNNDYSRDRHRLKTLIKDYGDDVVNLGNCFSTAERTTDVEIGLVRLFKPVVSSSFDYEGFYLHEDAEAQGNGIIPHNELRSIVNTYVAAVRCFEKHKAVADEMNMLTSLIGFGSGFKFNVSYNKDIVDKDDFARSLQRHCWQVIFNKMKIEKYVTSGVIKDINKFIESRKNYPFSLRNIYRMLEIIVGTREQTMNKAIVEAIDNLTQHTHENRFGVQGWKTNAGHLLNNKFIVDWMVEARWSSGYDLRYNGYYEKIADLTKALSYVTGKNHDDVTTIKDVFDNSKDLKTNTWYSSYELKTKDGDKTFHCTFFEFKFFKKGTMHIRFKNEKDWIEINRTYAKIKGQVLPEDISGLAA